MSLTGGKRKVNKSLKDWVTFVKKVQKEEKLSYKDAIHRAKIRKDKGEKWMTGGKGTTDSTTSSMPLAEDNMDKNTDAMDNMSGNADAMDNMSGNTDAMDNMSGNADAMDTMGGRRRRTMRRSRGKGRGRGRTARRGRGRASRRH